MGQVAIDTMLRRAVDLDDRFVSLLDDAEFDPTPRGVAAVGTCGVTFEHWASIRLLVGAGCLTPAIGLMRLQFEALTRAMWLLYAASDDSIATLSDADDRQRARRQAPSGGQ